MGRLRIIAAASVLATLAGCSDNPSSNEWLVANRAALMRVAPAPLPQAETLRFESHPPGAEVRTSHGQTCRTPCALAVPLQNQSVTFAMIGYLPQTIPIQLTKPGERSEVTFEAEPPSFATNPVEVSLEAVPPVVQAPPPAPQKPTKRAVKPAPPPTAAAPWPGQAVPLAASPTPSPPGR